MPAIGAGAGSKRPVQLNARGGLGSFTPAGADPRLAAAFARSGLSANGFRFTPANSAANGKRAVTVAVRARSNSTRADAERFAETAPQFSVTPIAYNLGVAVGWKRFALTGDVERKDQGGLQGGREAVDLGVSYSLDRVTARVKVAADRPLADAPRAIARPESYSLDVGSSYRLTRNLDVTAGLRYKTERDRLQSLQDDRRDSQAVYIGTAFKF